MIQFFRAVVRRLFRRESSVAHGIPWDLVPYQFELDWYRRDGDTIIASMTRYPKVRPLEQRDNDYV